MGFVWRDWGRVKGPTYAKAGDEDVDGWEVGKGRDGGLGTHS